MPEIFQDCFEKYANKYSKSLPKIFQSYPKLFQTYSKNIETKFKNRCIPEEEAFEVIYNLVEKSDYIVGHNFLGFDIYLLRNWYRKHGKNYDDLPHKTLDTFAMAKSVALTHRYKNSECSLLDFQIKMINIRKKGLRTSLGALGKLNNIDHDYANLHDALVDLELNIKVWDKLKYQIDF